MTLPLQDGYSVSTGYTYGYYPKLSPTWLRLVALARGVPFPDGEPFRYFELGFGQGVSLNVHAATNPGEYWGNDFNPEHVASARRMAKASGANVHILPDSFEDLAARDDLPQFHVVVAHGIWSWVSESARAAILKFLDEKLAPGGLFYVSYNALPGSTSGIAAQRFLHSVTASLDAALSESERFELARGYLGTIKDMPGSHFDHYPMAKERLEKILSGRMPYLLHEYAVSSWQPALLLEIAAQLKQVGLEFCGSAYLGPGDVAQPRGNGGAAELILHETLNDFGVDRRFRRDLFVRSPSRQADVPTGSGFGDQEIGLTVVPDEIDLALTDAADQEDAEMLRHILYELEGHSPPKIRICDLFEGAKIIEDEPKKLSALWLGLNNGLMHPLKIVNDTFSTSSSDKLNYFLSSASSNEENKKLRASSVIGAAIQLEMVDPIFQSEGDNPEKLVSILISNQKNNIKLSSVDILKYAVNYNARLKLSNYLDIKMD